MHYTCIYMYIYVYVCVYTKRCDVPLTVPHTDPHLGWGVLSQLNSPRLPSSSMPVLDTHHLAASLLTLPKYLGFLFPGSEEC